MSFDKLKGKMTEAHVSQAKLSEHLGITVQSLNAKLNGRTQFTLGEAIKITAFLNLKDPVDIFFSPSVPKMQQKPVSKQSEQEVSKVAETIERKPFKSIHIDTEKGIYLLNGEEVPMVSRIDLEFNNGKWSLLITRDELYVQEVEKN